MKRIEIQSFAKINLSLDVKGLLENGMHLVEMVMQQILLCDDINIVWEEDNSGKLDILLKTNRNFLPTDERNLAYKAAVLMNSRYGPMSGRIKIDIKKRIPVAAGLAGGSSNGAAVIHGLNVLWGLGEDVSCLCKVGAELGSDVPFCIMGQAAAARNLQEYYTGDPLACHCALATGTGTELMPLKGLNSHLVLSKPPVSVSTGSVYKGIDSIEIPEHPDTAAMIEGLRRNDSTLVRKNMVNVLENYTLKEYATVVYTKNKMQELCGADAVLMSGSGPTVFGLCDDIGHSQRVCENMKEINSESFWTRTTR